MVVCKIMEAFLFVQYLFYRPIVRIAVLRHVAGISSVGDDPGDPHEDVPVYETVVTAAQEVPR